MSYVVLARKWRPQSFDDLAGQGHVSQTLANAIAQGRVAHAFLFTGVRGVGKTTSARILAKALNCVKGPTATPCQVCAPCREITSGEDMDVREIDGASYNGVDEVRSLQETLPYRPARDRFKIFIVDEVHMLSNAAWNAFLKTLEEPPPHVKFIFATTEVHKVPVTILSRCQRYDFKLIGAQTIAARLKFVLAEEKVAVEDAAVAVLSREAAGSMRDAMSLLDQVLASVGDGEALTAEAVSRVLGVADRQVMHALAEHLVAGDAGECVRIVGELAQQGYDLPHVARDFLGQLRSLVVAKVAKDPGPLLDLADVELAEVKALASKADTDDLARLHQGFSKAFDDITKGGVPRAALEMTLVRLARRPPLLPIEELLRRLADLEKRLGGSGTSGPGAGGAKGPAGPPRRPTGGSLDAAPSAEPPPPPRRDLQPARPDPISVRPGGISVQPDPISVQREPISVQPAPISVQRDPISVRPQPQSVQPPVHSVQPQPPSVRPEAPAPSSRPVPRPTLAPEALAPWRAIVARVRLRRLALASVLEHAAVLEVGPKGVVVGYEANSFLAAQATDAAARELVLAEARAELGEGAEVTFTTVVRGQGAQSLAHIEAEDRKRRHDAAKRAVEQHPLVTAAIRTLGELKDVRLAELHD